MKKLFFIASVVLIMVMSTTPALACGSHHSGTATVRYTVCATKSCTQTGVHTHNGRNYTAHYYGDGHDYHTYCDTPDCVLTGYHVHDGVYCFAHTANDGHSYHHGNGTHH